MVLKIAGTIKRLLILMDIWSMRNKNFKDYNEKKINFFSDIYHSLIKAI